MNRNEIKRIMADQIHPQAFQSEDGEKIVSWIEDLLERQEEGCLDLPTLNSLNRRILDCTRCNLRNSAPRPTMGIGDHQAEILVVLDISGVDATSVLREVGKTCSVKVYVTHAVKCGAPLAEVRKLGPRAGSICRATWIDQEAQLVDPEVILIMGDLASSLVLGGGSVSRDRGNNPYSLRMGGKEYPAYCTYHPHDVLEMQGMDGRYRREYEHDLRRATRRVRRLEEGDAG